MAVYKLITTEAEARLFQEAVNVALALPRTESEATAEHRGGGRHVPFSEQRTESYSELLRHPTLPEFLHRADGPVPALNGVQVTVRGQPITIVLGATVERVPRGYTRLPRAAAARARAVTGGPR